MRRGSCRQRCYLMFVFLVIVQDYFVVTCDALCLGRHIDVSKNHFTLKIEVC